MECLKNCCKIVLKKRKEQETQEVIKVKMPPAPGLSPADGKRTVGVSEDYLLSKLPSDGREVPFVLPTFKPSYIQPRGSRFPNLQSGLQSSARSTYAERKAELCGTCHIIYNPQSSLYHAQKAQYVSPGSARRDTLKTRSFSPQSPEFRSQPAGNPRLSSSMFDLSSPQSHMQRFDSMSSVQSSASSMMSSIESSLDSITLSGDERDLGKVCVRVSYQEALEQVWITLVKCSDLNVPVDVGQQQQIGFKGIITTGKPIHFKSSIKEWCQDVVFMETFVFPLHLKPLRCSALVLRLQAHTPRKRTVAECVLSLRQLGPQETEHWLDLGLLSKTSVCHSELHLATCFQPVNGRIQLQVLTAQNLPASSTPLTQAFFIQAEMHQLGRVAMKKKTRALKATGGQCQWVETFHFLLPALDHASSLLVKLYSRSSVRRKQCLGQVQLGFDSPVLEAVEQWRDTMAHPEKIVARWHRLSGS
ncbi:tandem C2 domains nuclear protein [Lampris incognitus]|uniref:tandem C2 domains nuclear protein n=1 Tax=Lampris incognitus TaxID=2546036 RepID=UPI0024B54C3E|nr:tandem C2 domains nuclear protein [Lampris incognitus]